MKRSRAFRPSQPDPLEGRLVLSQVFFSPATGVILGGLPSHAELGRIHRSPMTYSVAQTKLADGKVLTTDTSTIPDGAAGTLTSKVTHEPDGSTRTVYETATVLHGTKTFTKAITLPDGVQQTETGTDVTSKSTTTILPDGTLKTNPATAPSLSRTTTFNHVITQAGLGTETIVGTSVRESSRNGTMTVTDQEVTQFDGSRDEVKIVSVDHNGSSTTRKTTILPGGASTMSVSTSRLLASTRP